MQRTFLPTGVVVLGLCLTGCSALKVGTAEDDSEPSSVGIDDGSETETPQKSAAPTIPAGLTEVTVDLGPECPIEVQLALGGGWNDDLAYDSYQLNSRDYGAVAGISDNGRLYKVSVEMVTVADDQTTAGLYAQMLPTVSFGNQVLASPTLS